MAHAAVLLLVALTFQPTPSLLPEAPEGWRFERLDFPLSFAPELDFRGFEELRFAPGMFQPDSESYFSYVFCIRLKEELAVDRDFLESFLGRYYRGLCRVVGESRGFRLDLSKVAAKVSGDGERFSATVEMFDVFVTGKALTVRIEMGVRPRGGGTELLGLVSPKPQEAPIWNELQAFRTRWADVSPLVVFFNHLYIVPDSETYDALADSEYLKSSFAGFEERTTVREDMSYTGLYFYGDHTYFEFLRPDTSPQFLVGDSGVALGIEVAGGTDRLAKRLKEGGVKTFAGPITREANGVHVPWFQIMGIEKPNAESRLSLFTLEYDPRFLAEWHPGLPPSGLSITRSAVLERYAAKLGQSERRQRSLFADVTEISFSLERKERERLLDVIRRCGYLIREEADRWICDGPRLTLLLRQSDRPGGITEFKMALRRSEKRDPIELGKAKLTFEGRTASFTWRP